LLTLSGCERLLVSGRCHDLRRTRRAVRKTQRGAVEALLLVVELNDPTMMARIGVMRALNRGYVREFDSSRKDTHWGKRKLKRAADEWCQENDPEGV